QTAPSAIEPTWKGRRATVDLARSLQQSANAPLEKWIEAVQPHHPEYAALQRALRDLRGQEAHGLWPKVPVRPLKPGTSDPAVAALRQRLAASGELAASDASDPNRYDEDLANAVKIFQQHHAMTATGIADRPTILAANVPISERIRQVELN